MPFPKYPDKHIFEALINPEDVINYKKWDKIEFPKKIIIAYQKRPLAYFKKKYKQKYKRLNLTGTHQLLVYQNIGFIRMTGIGSPHAVTIFGELIALGGKEFITLGSAGGLFHNGIFVCDSAVRDEGTSHHYQKDSMFSHPDIELTNKIKENLEKNKFEYFVGPTWTIDAPYRETKKEIELYKKEKIMTVDMEASALFTVATIRKVKIGTIFVVSDIIGKGEWKPEFHTINYKKTLNQMVEVAIN